MRKKLIFIFSILFALFIFVPNAYATMSIDAIQAKYKTGSKFTGSYNYTYTVVKDNTSHSKSLVAVNCAGFANTVYRNYYGFTAYFFAEQSTNVESVSSGDIVWYNSTKSDPEGHKVFVLSRNGESVVVAEANYDGEKTIRWYQTKSMSELRNNFKLIYKAPYPIGQVNNCIVPATSNVNVVLNSTSDGKNNNLKITWNQLDNVSGYRIIIKNSSGKNIYNYDTDSNISYHNLNSFNYTGDFTAYVYPLKEEIVSCTGASKNFSIIPISSINVNPEKNKIYMGDKINLNASVYPANTTYNTTISYSSSDTSIASVNSSGVVTGIGEGTATITASTKDGTKETFNITVLYKKSVYYVSLDKSNLEISVGDTTKITAKIYPSDATFSDVTWTSSNPSIAKVDKNGNVTGVRSGDVTITATADGVSNTANVHVISTSVEKIKFKNSSITITKGETIDMPSIDFYPIGIEASSNLITYSIDNTYYVSMNSTTHKLTAKNFGTATVTAKYNDIVATLTIYVVGSENIDYLQDYYQVNEIETYNFTVPNDVNIGSSNKVFSVSYSPMTDEKKYYVKPSQGGFSMLSSSNSNAIERSLAFVSIPINGMYAGDFNNDKKFTLDDLNYFDEYKDNVDIADINGDKLVNDYDLELLEYIIRNNIFKIVEYKELTTFELNKSETTIGYGKSEQLKLNITEGVPYTWGSSNEKAVTVDQNGVITSVGYGSSLIKVKARDQEISCTVTVEDKRIKKVNLNAASKSFSNIGDTYQLTASVDPIDTTDDTTITWSSSDENVVTVDSKGLVTVVGFGSASIKATASNGKYGSFSAYVNHYPITTVYVYLNSSPLYVGQSKNLNTIIYPSYTNDDKTLLWESSDTSIIKVDQNGTVTGINSGKATISATSINGKVGTVDINVSVGPITSINLNKTAVTISKNNTFQLIPTINPSITTTGRTVKWSSSNTSIATVDSNGLVKALKNGTVTITATTENYKSATCTITIADYKKGDFSKNGEVKLDDAIIGLRKVFGYISSDDNDLAVGDLNNNGKLDLADIIILLRYIFGYINSI